MRNFASHMLYITNEDKPGFIGRLGTLLGNAGVNIANFNLGRAARGSEAICVVQVDERVPDAVLQEIRAIPMGETSAGARVLIDAGAYGDRLPFRTRKR
jgi:L-serine deaminase